MFKGKTLNDFTNLFSPYDFKKNDYYYFINDYFIFFQNKFNYL